MGTTWADVSQYQGLPVDNTYPHRVLCFRTNTGSTNDSLAIANAQAALSMIHRGQLDAVIPYYFFRPGQANCDLHKEVLEQSGLWMHPRSVSMVDVEDAGGAITGDQSSEVNEEVSRLASWYGDPRRVIGYWNPVSNGGLWRTRPVGLQLVIPSYGRSPGNPSTRPAGFFAHQYTDSGQCAPWTTGVDLNYTDLELPELLASLGIGEGTMGVPEDVQAQLRGPDLNGWPQLGGLTLVDAVAEIRDQLGGPDHHYGGWPQLGGRTFVDALALVGETLKIPGFKAPKK